MSELLNIWRARPVRSFVVLAGCLTLLRIAVLAFSNADLGPDEAQYWVWSRDFAFGYFSKPPLIAWAIGLSTGLFGDSEWAARLTAPLFHLGAASFVFALGRRLYGDAAGFWAGIGWLVLPGVALSSVLITTDALLLFFWSAALYFFFRLVEARGSLVFAALLGAAVGLGMMSKYAMIYFPLGAGLAFALSADMRAGLKWRDLLVAALIAALMLAPNLAWNAAHDFRTIAHTAANARWNGSLLHPAKFAEFVVAQAGVFGPVPFLLLIWGAATLGKRLRQAGPARAADLALLAFVAPPLLIVSLQALISRAHANWAAAAFPAALILVTAWAFRARIGWLARAGALVHAAAAALFLAAFANFALADAVGAGTALRGVRGWKEAAAALNGAARGYDAVLVDDREVMGPLIFYAREAPPFMALDSNNRVEHHYEAFMPYDPARAERVLAVLTDDSPLALEEKFSSIRRVGEIDADLGSGRKRRLYLFEASGYRLPQGS